jgi:hypothetical protein
MPGNNMLLINSLSEFFDLKLSGIERSVSGGIAGLTRPEKTIQSL